MSEKTYTEMEVVAAQREGYARAAQWYGAIDLCEAQRRAAKFYPLPKVTRPRIVQDTSGIQWRFNNGYLQWRGHQGWERTQDYQSMAIDAERLSLWATLMDYPTEEVEADE